MMKIRAISNKNWHIRLIKNGNSIVIKNNEAGFWADPFIYVKDSNTHVFFENYLDTLKRGIISHVCINEFGEISKDTEIYNRPYHLSYPQLTEYNNKLYMIPESKSANCIQFLAYAKICEKLHFLTTFYRLPILMTAYPKFLAFFLLESYFCVCNRTSLS